jgi:hypothetical protein
VVDVDSAIVEIALNVADGGTFRTTTILQMQGFLCKSASSLRQRAFVDVNYLQKQGFSCKAADYDN